MKPFRVLSIGLVAALLAGCGGSDVPPAVDPDEAARQLRAALDAWKSGEPHDSLAAKTPPIVFTEPLWEGGTKLLTYELGPVELNGRQGRCTAKLVLQGKDGKQSERKIGYVIDTVPRVVIVRENLGM
jgi:hypothetical protein